MQNAGARLSGGALDSHLLLRGSATRLHHADGGDGRGSNHVCALTRLLLLSVRLRLLCSQSAVNRCSL